MFAKKFIREGEILKAAVAKMPTKLSINTIVRYVCILHNNLMASVLTERVTIRLFATSCRILEAQRLEYALLGSVGMCDIEI